MTRSWPILTLGLLAALATGCAAESVDITNSAGSPVATATSPSNGRNDPESIGRAPTCPQVLATQSDAALTCLGSGPAIDVLTLAGTTVVPVWASWCEPCRVELPILEDLHQEGLPVVGIAAADTSRAAAALTADLGISFPSVQDPESITRASLGWSGLPATFIVRDGTVVARFNGPIQNAEQIRQAVIDAESAPESASS